MDKAIEILQKYWKHDTFREPQEEIITSVLEGKDTFALMPTGGGKSICFQVPAMMQDGICLVISPLIALMRDQVENLQKKGIKAIALTGGIHHDEIINLLDNCQFGNYKFLYLSPERLQNDWILERIKNLPINLIAIDEAHCVSQWGHDFRPAYLKIVQLKDYFPKVPFLALTASATSRVKEDIVAQLKLNNPQIFSKSFYRANIAYMVFETEDKLHLLQQILQKNPQPSIIYVTNRKSCLETVRQLESHGFTATYYHGGLSFKEKEKHMKLWMEEKVQVIVATNAFGMGIDKANVKTIIHLHLPQNLENYYQEAGRAGRDGQKAYALLLYNEKDISTLYELSATRYPSVDFIKHVYKCLVNYLQIPMGIGEEEWRDFDIEIFTERFELPVQTTLYALQQLEQEGWLVYASKIHLPSRVEFVADRDAIDYYAASHPELESVIKTLLRTYGGIMDMEINISEYIIAKSLGVHREIITSALFELHQDGIIYYKPRKESPQIRFPEGRPVSDEWLVQPQQLSLRKKQFESRAQAIAEYAESGNQCRSVILGNYFGDTASETCGICDYCIAERNKITIDFNSFQSITTLLHESSKAGPIEIKSLLNRYSLSEREKILEVVDHLIQEEKIFINELGNLIFNK